MFGFVFCLLLILCSFRLCSFSFFLFHAPTQKERKRTKRKKNAALGFCICCVFEAFYFILFYFCFVFVLFPFSFLFLEQEFTPALMHPTLSLNILRSHYPLALVQRSHLLLLLRLLLSLRIHCLRGHGFLHRFLLCFLMYRDT